MPKNFPSFSRFILHEVQDKKQHFWILFEQADHSGEKYSNAEFKILILNRNLSETAAETRPRGQEQRLQWHGQQHCLA